MAIPTFSTSSTGTGTATTSVTVGHVVNTSLTDSLMVVMVTNPQFAEPTSCAWNGTAMSPLEFTSSNFWSQAFYLFGPEDGSYNAVITFGTTSNDIGVSILTFEGAKAIGNPTRQSATGTSPTRAVTSDEDDALLVSFTMSGSATHAPAGSETERTDSTVGSYAFSSQTLGVATAGSTNMTQTLGSSVTYQLNAFSIESVAPFTPQVLIM